MRLPKSFRPGQRAMAHDGCPIACLLPSPPHDLLPATTFMANATRTRDESEETKAFRAAEDERKRLKSLAQIGKMKARFAAKAVDYSKMRWDARRNKFVPLTGDKPHVPAPDQGLSRLPERPAQTKPAKPANVRVRPVAQAVGATGQDWSRINKETAEGLARLNGVWKPEYEKLRGTGRIVMTVGNVLKGLVKRGGTVKWQ